MEIVTLPAAVLAVLAASGLGGDTLQLIDNVLRHDGPPPRAAPPLVRELLADPLAAADAETLFRRAVPSGVAALATELKTQRPRPFAEALSWYIDRLAEAQEGLRAATSGAAIDEAALIGRLEQRMLSADLLLGVADAVDREALERVAVQFMEATVEFARAARAATDFPATATRFDSSIGIVSIGTRGNDHHGADAALIVDPGGDDHYTRKPLRGGGIAVIVDLGGNDTYAGSDLVVRGLSAIVDLSGNDRYEADGPGLGAAIAGAALLFDLAGDDSYRSGYFGQGAAAFGIGALIDLQGNDRYAVRAWGQGLGLAGGLGLLWDRDGNDLYSAGGQADSYGRGTGGISGAQGAAFGFRNMLGGGIGILRDDSGDDRYEAEMFAQGLGYYYGLGLLWDRAGRDQYRAVRYAQGAGVHQAVGVLRDQAGDDRYELAFGVGQGFGLDLAVGALVDDSGDDDYRARVHAQATASANGIGLLADGGGSNRWEVSEDTRAWGHAEWLRDLPSVGLLVHDSGRATFIHAGRETKPAPRRVVHEKDFTPDCRDKPATPDPRQVRLDDFDAVLAFSAALRCASIDETMWAELERHLAANPATTLAGSIAAVLPSAPEAQRRRILAMLQRHPRCGVRALVITDPQAALRSSCWRLQAAALAELASKQAATGPGVSFPSFLPPRPAY
jgi:hypothetical protein